MIVIKVAWNTLTNNIYDKQNTPEGLPGIIYNKLKNTLEL